MFKNLTNAELVSDLESYGLSKDDVKQGMYISWDSTPNESNLESTYSKRFDKKPVGPEYDRWRKISIAMNARKNWIEKVMPTLKPGTILYNDPEGGSGGSRDNIYQKMGFGRTDDKGKQYAVVVMEDGKKIVKPLRLTDKQKSKGKTKEMVEEAFSRLIKYSMRGVN